VRHSKPSLLAVLRQWWSGRTEPPLSLAAVQAWCAAEGFLFKPAHGHTGFVVEPASADWRLEWGPSQRPYLGSHELRLRGDTGIDPQTYAVLMPRPLLLGLERELYGEFVEGVQTRLDEATPEELRWLAMAPKLGSAALGDLREQVAGVGNVLPWVQVWLAGTTGAALRAALADWDTAGTPGLPFALLVRQGRLVLRLGLATPDAQILAAALRFYLVALSGARQFADMAPPATTPDPQG